MMVMSKVPKARMTIMTDPGVGAGAGVGHYGAIMATMMGNLSHDWPRSRQEPSNVPKRATLKLWYTFVSPLSRQATFHQERLLCSKADL